jgi:adenosylcobinamide amidohydrolase
VSVLPNSQDPTGEAVGVDGKYMGGEAIRENRHRCVGAFPASAAGNVNVIVAVDYFTKWAEARAIKTATARDAAEFFVEEIALRHGAPESVVTDCDDVDGSASSLTSRRRL